MVKFTTLGAKDGPIGSGHHLAHVAAWPDILLTIVRNSVIVFPLGGADRGLSSHVPYRIRKITPDGVVSTLAGSGVAGFADGAGNAAQFASPYGIAVNSAGQIYVTDRDNRRVREITPGGVVSTLAGASSPGFADGAGSNARFSYPRGIAVDTSGQIYVADSNNSRIRKITPSGVVSTLAGGASSGFADGVGTVARFSTPYGVAVDVQSNVYVANMGNNRIRKVTPNGIVTTIAGSGIAGNVSGVGLEAQFKSPQGVAVDAQGIVFVADSTNHILKKVW